jgi:hypothetical protein
MWLGDPSLRSGFRLRAPASLTPAKRLNLARGDLVGDIFGKDVDSSHFELRPVSQMRG